MFLTHFPAGRNRLLYRLSGEHSATPIVPRFADSPSPSQVNLVDQPVAILDKMKNGTYVVNYSLDATHVGRNPALIGAYDPDDPPSHWLDGGDGDEAMVWDGEATTGSSLPQPLLRSGSGPESLVLPSVLLDTVIRGGMDGLENDVARKQFQRLLLDNVRSSLYPSLLSR